MLSIESENIFGSRWRLPKLKRRLGGLWFLHGISTLIDLIAQCTENYKNCIRPSEIRVNWEG